MQTSVTWKIKAQIKALSKLLLLRLKLSREKIKNPAVVENVFFSPELEVGTYINLFESSMKWPFIKSLITQNEPNKNLFTNPDFEGMTLRVSSYHTSAKVQSIS